ncbi:MAG: PcfJ domain-containing protein, partial [Bacteroidaceae bacterium]|nr:PcfJ domain-containing protein [Bacteroidaceae bacterium]
NKVVTDIYGNVKNRGFTAYKDHTYDNFRDFISCTTRVYHSKHYIDEFVKFYGTNSMTIRSGRIIEFSYTWSVWSWWVYKPIAYNSTKHKLVDTLTSIQLSDTSDFHEQYKPIQLWHEGYRNDLKNFVYFERVNDTWSVLRGFYRGYTGTNPPTERWRLYISDSGKLQMVSKASNSSWTHSRIGTYVGYYFANKAEAIAKCNRIKYILQSYTDSCQENVVPMLIRALQYPEVEQLIKLGHANVASRKNGSITFRADMKHEFGGYYNPKEKNFLKKIGMTKSQFDVMMEYEKNNRSYGSDHLRIMRSVFGDDLSHVDIESFKKYYRGFAQMASRAYAIDNNVASLSIDRMRFYKNLIRLGEKNVSAYQLAGDTFRGYIRLDEDRKPRIDWMFDSYSDLVRAHNSIDELCRQQDAERRAYYAMTEAERRKQDEEKRIKLDKERVKYEYEDDKYIIRLPRNLTEIVDEGSIQRICIGGYTGTHSSGACTIFFLRHKSAPNTPFYAIEVRGNRVNQIHGYCNKWLGNNPEAIPTVMRWLRKHNIQCETGILTCTAQGYGRTGNYVKLPEID